MTTPRGSATSVSSSSAASYGGSSTFQKPSSHAPTSSTSSFSSTSVVTAKRASSSVGPATRNSFASIQAPPPTDASLIALRVGREQISPEHRRRRSVAVDPSERASADGHENVNRWSTASSVASLANTRRSRASSGAVLPALLHKSFSPQKPRNTPESLPSGSSSHPRYSDRPSVGRPGSPSGHSAHSPSTSRDDSQSLLTALAPLHTTSALANPSDAVSPGAFTTVTTPSTAQTSYTNEYFGTVGTSPRSNNKGKQALTPRDTTGTATIYRSSPGPNEITEQEHAEAENFMPYRHDRAADDPSTTRSLEYQYPGPRSTAENETGHSRSRTRSHVERDKKALLSKALQKANAAVLLDNAQNFEAALEAYTDACSLLQEVMDRSSAYEDKRKLHSIRSTYTNRITELKQMEVLLPAAPTDEQTLPDRPTSAGSLLQGPDYIPRNPAVPASPPPVVPTENRPIVHVAPPEMTSSGADSVISRDSGGYATPRVDAEETPLTAKRIPSEPSADVDQHLSAQYPDDLSFATSQSPLELDPEGYRGRESYTLAIATPDVQMQHLSTGSQENYIPRPLSPRRPSVPELRASEEHDDTETISSGVVHHQESHHIRKGSNVSMSWLDTIDESARSSYSSSSIHSRSSQHGLHRRPIPNTIAVGDPDFDAAFDAAVEAAYDEGFEPDLDVQREIEPAPRRHAPQESLGVRASQIQELWPPMDFSPPAPARGLELDDEEEEERILDEITQDFAQTFNFDFSTKSALPRESDSSGYSRDTWQSSLGSSERTTAATSLSTVVEDTLPPQFAPKPVAASPSISAPIAVEQPASLAPPAPALAVRPPVPAQALSSSVRNRRLSGQNATQLKIETSKPEARNRASTYHLGGSPFREDDEQKVVSAESNLGFALDRSPPDHNHDMLLKSPLSLTHLTTISDDSRPATARSAATTMTEQLRNLDESEADELLTMRPSLFRNNKSSASLREHTILLSPTDHLPPVNATPMSSTFLQYGLRRPEGPLTSQRANFPSLASAISDGSHASSVQLFDTSLTSTPLPSSPRSPPGSVPPPVGLEPCPESFLLRPFWLMRAIHTTLAHPKGGFITSRLFVPREVWKTQGVKLKNIEDKIANCDLLTAALGRLAGVDTYDADAIMEELQSFEEVMERVQANLAKRLGTEVGVNGVANLFKDAAAAAAAATTTSPTGGPADMGTSASAPPAGTGEKTKSKEGKSGGYLTSWRKLRSKSSGAPLGGSHSHAFKSGSTGPGGEKDPGLMASVPMTSFVPVERRGHRKDARVLTFEGPNREYMGSLARLLDGAQVLDQIARQVEDPGLKGTSPTHVGLELSTRHAAEFFGFYICRFALADLGILLDKFVKRGSEWVLA